MPNISPTAKKYTWRDIRIICPRANVGNGRKGASTPSLVTRLEVKSKQHDLRRNQQFPQSEEHIWCGINVIRCIYNVGECIIHTCMYILGMQFENPVPSTLHSNCPCETFAKCRALRPVQNSPRPTVIPFAISSTVWARFNQKPV